MPARRARNKPSTSSPAGSILHRLSCYGTGSAIAACGSFQTTPGRPLIAPLDMDYHRCYLGPRCHARASTITTSCLLFDQAYHHTEHAHCRSQFSPRRVSFDGSHYCFALDSAMEDIAMHPPKYSLHSRHLSKNDLPMSHETVAVSYDTGVSLTNVIGIGMSKSQDT